MGRFLYRRANLGYVAGTSNVSTAAPVGGIGTLDLFSPYDAFKGTGSYALGLQAGYNFQHSSRWLVGIEADLASPNRIGGNQVVWLPGLGARGYEERILLSGTVRGRVGYAMEGWLPYATVGLAWSYDQLRLTGDGASIPGRDRFAVALGLVRRSGRRSATGAGLERTSRVSCHRLWTRSGELSDRQPARAVGHGDPQYPVGPQLPDRRRSCFL